MTVRVLTIPIVDMAATFTEPLCVHIVCHCTNNRMSWCHSDRSGQPFADDSEDIDCPLCVLAEEASPDACPWGCQCEECGPSDLGGE